MFKIMMKAFIILFFSALIVVSSGEAQEHELNNFRGGAILTTQDSGLSSTYSLIAGWNPRYHLNEQIKIGADLAITSVQDRQRHNYAVIEYQVSLGYKFEYRTSFELTYGRQSWIGFGGEGVAYGATFTYPLDQLKWYAKNFYAGYCYIHQDKINSAEFRIGAEFSF